MTAHAPPFVDYYQLLACSPEDSLQTIENAFQQLASEFNPDTASPETKQRLSTLIQGYQVLRDPQRRREFDREYKSRRLPPETAPSEHHSRGRLQPDPEAVSSTINDTEDRKRILEVLCARRRTNMKSPGLPLSTVVDLSGCDEQAIEFHLWYFMQKGWVQREESGVLSITATGVDRIDEINLSLR